MAARKSKQGFNQVLSDLEAIVEKLEDSDTSLEDSMAAFEKGIALTRSAQKMLEEAEQKVLQLTETDDGEPSIVDFDDGDD